MPRRSNRRTRAFAQPAPATRLTSLLMMLFVLGLMYSRAKDPATWRWLAPEPLAAADQPVETREAKTREHPRAVDEVVAGPTDEDPDEWDEAQRLFGAISDKAALDRTEMPAYWRLMKWARAQTFAELASRARGNMTYTQFWEQPDRLRGKLVRLKLHVRRAIHNDAIPKNPLGLEHVFELWGATDESKSYPYALVVDELPADLPTGGDVHYDVEFVGYFLKLTRYEAFDKARASPLLIGRIRSLEPPPSAKKTADGQAWIWTVCGAIAMVSGAWLWVTMSKRKRPAPAHTSISEASVENWLSNPPPDDQPPVSPAGPA